MPAAPQSSESPSAPQTEAGGRASRPEPMDEKLSPDQSGKNRSVGSWGAVSASRRQTNSVGRARTARPSSRLIYPKTAARGIHQSRWVRKNQNPQNGQHWARFDWGFGAICFGAIPVAAVFGSSPRSATSRKHQIQHKSTLTPDPSKQDISTWQGIGHFYLALTAPGRLLNARAGPCYDLIVQ
jgi:hypothetical protein